MTTPGGIPANVQNRDVACAQVALDTWAQAQEEQGRGAAVPKGPDLLVLRGVLAAQFSEVREAGYLEGVQVGRRQMAYVMWDALTDEGFSPSWSDPRELEK